jgi:hypothetical protein
MVPHKGVFDFHLICNVNSMLIGIVTFIFTHFISDSKIKIRQMKKTCKFNYKWLQIRFCETHPQQNTHTHTNNINTGVFMP